MKNAVFHGFLLVLVGAVMLALWFSRPHSPGFLFVSGAAFGAAFVVFCIGLNLRTAA